MAAYLTMLHFKAVCLKAVFLGLVLYNNIVVATSTGQIFRSACRRDVLMNATARDKKLTGTLQNIIANMHVTRPSLCVKKCIEASKCRTINYKKYSQQQEKNCELLDISRANTSVALSPDVGWIYFEPVSQVSARCKQVVCNSGFTCTATCSNEVGYECIDINECASNPCQNNGTCADKVNEFSCTCTAGYEGTQCQTNRNECASSPCQNGGTCVDEVNHYSCTCAPGYEGTLCQIDINECASSPCQNGGTCVDGVNQYTCTCAAGYEGAQCQTNINECASSPCQNGGTCADGINQYTCTCAAGYGGTQCQATTGSSCRALYLQGYTSDGVYLLQGASGSTFNAYCHMTDGGWTLIARFSNADAKNWMQSSGSFWYDQGEYGSTTSPSTNADMINRAFFEIAGNDIKLSRSDVSAHSFLLYAGACFPSSTTFRGKMSSYGNFRSNVRWLLTNNGCKGSCTIHSYGSVSGVGGFSQYSCSGDLKPSNTLGFWCHYSTGDGAVLMIGGGGSACGRADHGVGVTEANNPIFGSLSETHDFGNDGLGTQTTAYSLNLWIR